MFVIPDTGGSLWRKHQGIIVLHNGVSNKLSTAEAASSFYCELQHKQHLPKHAVVHYKEVINED